MAQKEPWYLKEVGPDKELRIFFQNLLETCLEMGAGSGAFKDIIKHTPNNPSSYSRPFTNTFNQGKKGHTIFTHTTLCNFLNGALRKNSIKKAVDIIKSSEYTISSKDLNKCDFKKMELCPNIHSNQQHEYLECIKFALENKKHPFRETCENCPVKLIYEVLPKIENECHTRFLNQKQVLKKYASIQDKKIINSIYKDIQRFEDNFKSRTLTADLVCELYSECIQCANIRDVSDSKMAYVKWYTARLCTWPYFKSCLLYVGRYDETIVYSLLRSASAICSVLPLTEESLKLSRDIETDKIISYISLAYQNPFMMSHCETPEAVLANCSRITEVQPEDQSLFNLSTEMWNLALHSQNNADSYKEKAEYLMQQNKTLDTTRYYVYSYMYNLCDCEIPQKLLSQKAKQLRKHNTYNDTINVMTEIFLTKAFNDNSFSVSGNLTADIMAVQGYDTLVKTASTEEINILAAPSLYQRTYGDNMLTQLFKEYKKYSFELDS